MRGMNGLRRVHGVRSMNRVHIIRKMRGMNDVWCTVNVVSMV